jgi:ABC-type transport system involved in cytochrome c biogenesis permease subunit
MNRPLKYHHFRFCQSDYDSDEMGVVLAYNYDPWGIGITYTGYALLLVAMIAFFFQRRTYFRTMLKSVTSNSLLLGRAGVGLFAVLVIALAIIMTKVVTPKPPLQPVLQTPLLGIHVSVIMLAYTLFAIIAINGIIGLCSRKHSAISYQLSVILLYPAEFCLMAGIFIGAVWANMSWGRYWGWDPKETWALITMLVYALLLHFPWLKRLTAKRSNSEMVLHAEPVQQCNGHVVFHILSVIAFLFVLFTYFGVTYLLGGLHSYAN